MIEKCADYESRNSQQETFSYKHCGTASATAQLEYCDLFFPFHQDVAEDHGDIGDRDQDHQHKHHDQHGIK